MDTAERRAHLEAFFAAALVAIDPERLTTASLRGQEPGPVTIVAIGKAAAAMARGAATAFGVVSGICVTNHESDVPNGIELIIGDHPIPGERSFAAGRRVLDVIADSETRIVALISGGGSSLCELPRRGVSARVVTDIYRRLVDSGASIVEMNLVRRHLSVIKGGGLLAVASQPVDTYVISDVCGATPDVIASGPTIPQDPDPDAALAVIRRVGIDVPPEVIGAIADRPAIGVSRGDVVVVADGRTAARAIVDAAAEAGVAAEVSQDWLSGPVETALSAFMDGASMLRVAAGEPEVEVHGDGLGGRNTHAALLAARKIVGSKSLFAALATDGVDGNSSSAGAIVDGGTLTRGGDPAASLAASDSAGYLASTGDLVCTGPTGTNVADLWLFWP